MHKYTTLVTIIVLGLAVIVRTCMFYSQRPVYKDGEVITQVVRIISEPKVRGRYQQFSVRLKDSTTFWVTTEKFPPFHFGQEISAGFMLPE
jgi:PDZ domain-containing secreted protein